MSETNDGIAARQLGTLALVALAAASLVLFAAEVASPALCKSLLANQLRATPRHQLILALVIAVALASITVSLLAWRRRADREWLPRLGRSVGPLLLLGPLPLVVRLPVTSDALTAALAFAAFTLASLPLTRPLFAALEERRQPPGERTLAPHRWRYAAPLLLLLGVLAYAVYMSFFTLRNHAHFQTSAFDLGIFDNLFWNALHGHPFWSTPVSPNEGDLSMLRQHAEFALYLLLPVYALFPGARTLLILQSVILASGAVPIYRLTARRLSRPAALLLAFAYLLYPGLHGANFYDFHFLPVGGVFVLWAIDFIDEKRRLLGPLFFLFALTAREDLPVVLACFGLYFLFTDSHRRAGSWMLAVSIPYFIILKFVVMAHFGRWFFADHYQDLYPPDSRSYGGVIETLLVNPVYVFTKLVSAEKLRYFCQVLAPLAFVPLTGGLAALLLVPGFFFTLLSNHGPIISIGFQYTAYWFACVFIATAYALVRLRRRSTSAYRATLFAIALGSLLFTAGWGAFPPRPHFQASTMTIRFEPPTTMELARARDLEALAELVPHDAKLAVSDHELAHLSTRLHCFDLRDGERDAEYILYTLDSGYFGSDKARSALGRGEFKTIATRPGLALLQRIRTGAAPR